MLPPRTVRPKTTLRPQHQRRHVPEPIRPPQAAMWTPPVRLRHLLLLGLLGALGAAVVPRVRALWQAHDLGGKVADYALCMAGPTGPERIRDDLLEFRRLVRRRLIAAAPQEAPFARCAPLSGAVTGSLNTERAHLTPAAGFLEYGAGTALAEGIALSTLHVDLGLLAERTRQAWPLMRGGYARLVRPSLGAREAVHPVGPARPGTGRGLPSERALPKRAWRTADALWVSVGEGAQRTLSVSTDEGNSFRKARTAIVEEARGGCGGKDPERGFGMGALADGSLRVTSFVPNREPASVTAVTGEHVLLAVACDDQALVLAAHREDKGEAELVLCPHERSCAPLRPPQTQPFAPLKDRDFDVARVASATVLAVERNGIVRVVSTRDDGRTWTPPTVAFDVGEHAVAGAVRMPAPARLLALGSRLFLYGASRREGEPYALLVSDDQGASFRAPGSEEHRAPAAPRLARGAR